MAVVTVAMLLCTLTLATATDYDTWLDTLPHAQPAFVSCTDRISKYKSTPAVKIPAPREMPPSLIDEFTMNGTIAVGKFFVDDTLGGSGSHYQFPAKDVEYMVSSATKYLKGEMSQRRLPLMDQWILEALKRHSVKTSQVVVFGSMSPWYEAMAVAAGAEHVHTVEYNELTYHHPKMTQTTPSKLQVPEKGFDVAFSISSFDHDGLGRYGDPVTPSGDVAAMALTQCILKPGGLLFLTLPVGPDVVVWNLHRRYGEVRLPHMLANWEVVEVIGWTEAKLHQDVDWRQSYEPVFVLRSPHPDVVHQFEL